MGIDGARKQKPIVGHPAEYATSREFHHDTHDSHPHVYDCRVSKYLYRVNKANTSLHLTLHVDPAAWVGKQRVVVEMKMHAKTSQRIARCLDLFRYRACELATM